MKRIAIITDSTAVMEDSQLEEYPYLYTLPLQIIFQNDVYYDGDISQDCFFKLIEDYDELPSTSQPLVGQTKELLAKLLKTYQSIIYVTISSKISGTYQTCSAIASELEPERIKVFDSLLTATVQKRMVIQACEEVRKGASVDQIMNCLTNMRSDIQTILVVDDLKYLERTGRINGAVASIGTMLQIKPIVKFDNGLIIMDTKVRTITKAINYLLKQLNKQKVKNNTHILIAHASGYDYALRIEKLINQEYPNFKTSISELSPVISVHTGPKSVGISWVNGY